MRKLLSSLVSRRADVDNDSVMLVSSCRCGDTTLLLVLRAANGEVDGGFGGGLLVDGGGHFCWNTKGRAPDRGGLATDFAIGDPPVLELAVVSLLFSGDTFLPPCF